MKGTRNRLLEFLTARPQPDGEASRSNRRRTTTARVELAWLEDGTWRATHARLLDISHGGAGLNCRELPTVGSLARVRFVEGEGSPWVEAKILGVDPLDSRDHRVRIRFEGNCPGFLLRLAVLTNNRDNATEDEPMGDSWAMVKAAMTE